MSQESYIDGLDANIWFSAINKWKKIKWIYQNMLHTVIHTVGRNNSIMISSDFAMFLKPGSSTHNGLP
jgi:hypothetical protein